MTQAPAHSNTHRARKRFGQNFLVDLNIIDKIIGALSPKTDDKLIEIGPGQGALTAPLLNACPNLTCIEVDRDLAELLKQRFSADYPAFTLVQADALKTDFSALAVDGEPLRIIGNLPYNISTPLIFHLLSFHQQIKDMHFMLQKEVVDRLAATPGSKAYGRLSVMTQYYCQVQPLFTVPASAFRPAPKVESAVVRLRPHQQLPYTAQDAEHLASVVRACFQLRRKTLRNCLKSLLDTEQLQQIDIDLTLRPENLSVGDFVQISNQVVTLHG